uniref:Cnidarian restricted protein n=1 Tax=Clytia hemisphaerica TaxID=252671 RepID=A0A7M5WYA0_9CNID
MKQTFFYMFIINTLLWSSMSVKGMFDGVKQGFFTCDEIRNVTLLLNIHNEFSRYQEQNADMLQPVAILVKSLLDTPCVMVWIYSPLQARSIRQQRHNYKQFLTTEMQIMTSSPVRSLFVEFLRDFSMMVGREIQTLLVIEQFFWIHLNECYYTESSSLLKKIDGVPNTSVVVWCVSITSLCQQNHQDYFGWMPRYRFITFQGRRANRYVQKALYDLMMNSDYDRYKDYGSLDEYRDRSSKLVLRFAIRQRFYGSGSLYDYFLSIFSSFFNIQMEMLIVLRTHNRSVFGGFAEYLFQSNRSSKIMSSRFLSKAEFLDMFLQPDPGVLNINIIEHLTGSQIARRGFVFRQLLTLHVFDSISESPRLRIDGSFILSYEDLSNPMFIRMFIARIKELMS